MAENGEETRTIEDKNTDEYTFGSLGDVFSWRFGLCCSDWDTFDAGVSVGSVGQTSPESKKPSGGASDPKVLHEGTRTMPILKADGLMTWTTTTSDDQSHKVETNDK